MFDSTHVVKSILLAELQAQKNTLVLLNDIYCQTTEHSEEFVKEFRYAVKITHLWFKNQPNSKKALIFTDEEKFKPLVEIIYKSFTVSSETMTLIDKGEIEDLYVVSSYLKTKVNKAIDAVENYFKG